MFKNFRLKPFLLDLAFYLAGGLIYSLSINIFTAPNHIAPGGATGAATMINFLTGAPIGVTTLLINIPLFLIGWRLIGHDFIIKTAIATTILSVAIDLVSPFLPHYTGDVMLASVYGGVLSGIGLGIVFLRGATTGGSDLLARLVIMKLPHFSMGRSILIIDFFVIVAAAFVYGQIESSLYALIMIFVSTQIINALLYGVDTGKLLIIVSNSSGAIAKHILDSLQRGVTVLKAQGAWTGDDKNVLLCAVRRQEVHRVRAIVREEDPEAFLIVSNASDILGEGFKDPNKTG